MGLSEVTLIDGTRVPSDSEAWRAECEARGVLNLPNRMARLAWIRKVESRRGKESADKLYRDTCALHQHELRKARGDISERT